MKNRLSSVMSAALLVAAAGSASAATFDWANWTSTSGGSVMGNIGGGITVTYSGEYNWAQLNNSGTYFYTGASQNPTDVGPYGAGRPTTTDLISINGDSTVHTITFSSPVTDPIMAIVSLGQPSITTTYNFNTPFTILSDGAGWWGGPGTLLQSANSLIGIEGDGLIEFQGTVSSISWTGAYPEYWNGFTIGAGVPEVFSTAGLLCPVLAALAMARKGRKQTA